MSNYLNVTDMKKMFFALVMMLTATMSARAMSYEQARSEALFLTDKMAYELNLTDEQYEAAYEINLDYLMGVTGRSDVFGTYWERRNLDLSYILLDWQWQAYLAATYFYRPLYWEAGYWHFGVYRRYPHRDYFYFGRPHFYATYRGGHAWHIHGGHGYYYGRRSHFRSSPRAHFGMHDRWNRGDFRTSRHSSTRITAGPNNNRRGSFGASSDRRRIGTNNNGINRRYESNSYNGRSRNYGNNSNSFGGSYGNRNRSFGNNSNSNSTRTFGGSSHSSGSRTFGGSSHGNSNRSFGSSSHSSGSRSFGGGSSSGGTRSFGGGSRSGGMSHGGGSSHSHGGGGGSHFGGHR